MRQVVQLSADHIDRSSDVWVYRPPTHKTDDEGEAFAKSPSAPRRRKPCWRVFRERCFTHKVASIRQAVKRTAKRAGVAEWFRTIAPHHGHQSASGGGSRRAQALSGHARADVTQVYAESVAGRAAEVRTHRLVRHPPARLIHNLPRCWQHADSLVFFVSVGCKSPEIGSHRQLCQDFFDIFRHRRDIARHRHT